MLGQPPPVAPHDLQAQIEGIVKKALAKHGLPGVSIAVVKDGKLAFAGAYGNACMEPRLAARPEMRYGIGSINKQMTAAALFLLIEQGKLSLDDKIARFLPTLTRANEVSIRMLLSHTSGYRDYWPHDYVVPSMLEPIAPEGILERWARIPLDFEPGTQWQYSNTNYVIAGLIIEKVSGMPFMNFLRAKVLEPLGMKDVVDLEARAITPPDPVGYRRHGLGPLRPAPRMGKGWLFAVGQLAMSASELAKWDVSLLERSLLQPSSYAQLTTEVLLKNGVGTHYGLGIQVDHEGTNRMLRHRGEISGFSATNWVMPENRSAIVVLTNQDASYGDEEIASQIKAVLLATDKTLAIKARERDRKIFAGLQRGMIDRALFTENANSYFTEQAIKDFAAGLAPLGTPLEFKDSAHYERGGMLQWEYEVKLPKKALRVWSRELPNGKLEEFLVTSTPQD